MATCPPKPALHRGGQKMDVSETRQGLLASWWSFVLEEGACPAGCPRRHSLSLLGARITLICSSPLSIGRVTPQSNPLTPASGSSVCWWVSQV